MALDGTFYFESTQGGRLFFGKQDDTFYFYRLEGGDEILRLLFLAIPRLPMCRKAGLVWQDVLPISVATRGLRRVLALAGASLWPNLARINSQMAFDAQGAIESTVTSAALGVRQQCQVEFAQSKGIAVVRTGGHILRRVAHGTD